MSNLQVLFKEPIYIVDNILSEQHTQLHNTCMQISKKYDNYADKWNPGTSFVSISEGIQPHKDERFDDVTKTMFNHGLKFMDELGFGIHQKNKLFVTRSWFNISYQQDYLERHVHPQTLFSTVYYVETALEDRLLFVRNAYEMMDRPTDMNEWSETVRYFDCLPKRLLIFKGNIMHGVNKQIGGMRNVIVYNFAIKNT